MENRLKLEDGAFIITTDGLQQTEVYLKVQPPVKFSQVGDGSVETLVPDANLAGGSRLSIESEPGMTVSDTKDGSGFKDAIRSQDRLLDKRNRTHEFCSLLIEH